MPYGISKAALNSLQAGLVEDCAALDIRINAVSPGMTRTESMSMAVHRCYVRQ